MLVADDVDRPDSLLASCHLERRAAATYLGLFAVRPDTLGWEIGAAMPAAAEAHARILRRPDLVLEAMTKELPAG